MTGSEPAPANPPEPQKLTRAQRLILRKSQEGWKHVVAEMERAAKEGDWDRFTEITLGIIEVFQGTARLTASSRRLEIASYVLIVLTGTLAIFTYLLWARHF